MPRRTPISDDALLEAARAAFLAEGPGASTASIAERAGISEALLFKRFESKHKLFLAAMGVRPPSWLEELPDRVGQGEPRATLEQIATDMLDWMSEAVPVIAMRWAGNAGVILGQPRMEDPPAAGAVRSVAAYFEEEMRLGRIRACDPEVAARMLIASIWHHVWFELIGVNRRLPMPRTTYVRGIVDLLWVGLSPEDGPRAGS